jgi:transcriptional regulator with XRE-family HTH domain
MSPGEKISLLRKNKGLSQEVLAENSKTSLRTIQRIERDETVPRPYTIKAIADALGVQIEEITKADPGLSPDGNDYADLHALKVVNASVLFVCFLPPFNIVLPLLLWRKYKHDPSNVAARRTISFQILWTILLVLTIIAVRLLMLALTGSVAIGHFPLILIIYFVLVSVNVFFILRAAIQIGAGNQHVFPFVPLII